ncbi:MAG: hypothetical protein WC262_10095, partial [Bacteroidales bacterium]
MSYEKPSIEITQEFETSPVSNDIPLYPCVIGPQYASRTGSLGEYDSADGVTFTSWPGHVSGSDIDLTSAVFSADDGLLEYLAGSVDGTSHGASGWDGLLVNGGNRVRMYNKIFKTSTGYARTTTLGTRDVAVGDKLLVTKAGITTTKTVIGLAADSAAAATGSAAASTANKTAETASSAVVAHFTGETTLATTGTDFDGLALGLTSETYTCAITATDGNWIGSTIRYTSASGLDSGTVVVDDAAIELGALGVIITAEEPSEPDLVIGDYFTVTASMAFTPVVPTASGTYTGTASTTYIVTVTEGGVIGTDTVKFSGITADGSDTMQETSVTEAGSVAVGSYGVLLTLTTAHQYCTNDIFTVVVTAAGAGAYRTLILDSALTGYLAADVFTYSLCLVDDIELEPNDYTIDEDGGIIAAAAQIIGSYLGTAGQAFDLLGGDLSVTYRELIKDNIATAGLITDPEDVAAALGTVSSQNPLALMVYSALTECGGTGCYYIGVASNDLAGYTAAVNAISTNDYIYSMVPYSQDAAIVSLTVAAALASSAPAKMKWKVVFFGNDVADAFQVVAFTSTTSGAVVTTTDGDFITAGIVAGDTMRINYRQDATGAEVYDSYIVESVDSETQLTLTTSVSPQVVVAVKTELWRTRTNSELATAIAAQVAVTTRRASPVFVDGAEMLGETSLSSSYAAAAAAGMRCAQPPHRPLTNLAFTSLGVTNTHNFSDDELDTIAARGVWIISKR